LEEIELPSLLTLLLCYEEPTCQSPIKSRIATVVSVFWRNPCCCAQRWTVKKGYGVVRVRMAEAY
jgi:hypothetical protein